MKMNRRLWLSVLAGFGFGCTSASRFPPTSSATMKISKESLQWMENAAAKEIQGCQIKAHNGITLFTPDGSANYGALWTRDFYYMLQLFDRFDEQDVRFAIKYLLDGISENHIAPDRRQADGITVYEAGGVGHPVALPPLDNAAFLVSLVYLYSIHTDNYGLASHSLLSLNQVMQKIPRSEFGLVWNDPEKPHSPYGFTDTIGKTGELLFCSLLDWKAANEIMKLCQHLKMNEMMKRYQTQINKIEKNIFRLLDDKTGLFFAASHDCRQLDVWGNAFMVSIGFPLPTETRRNIVSFFANRYDEVIEKGQVRHLINGEYWNRLLIPVEMGRYQNGGYWGTPSGWVITALAEQHPIIAEKIWEDLVMDYQTRGIHEWVNGETVRLPHYVASVTNPLASVRQLIQLEIARVV